MERIHQQALIKVFRQAGMRLTKPRRAIVDIVLNSQKALGPRQIYDLARRNLPRIGLVTVYRTLDVLEKTGMTERIHSGDHCRAVSPVLPGHNHVLICSTCGNAVRFDGEDLSDLFSKITEKTGFFIHDHLLQLFGNCPECQKRKNDNS